MVPENTILQDEIEVVRELQQTIRRELNRRRTALKAVGYDSGIGYSTLVTYFPDGVEKPHALSVAALRRLCFALPADLLSVLLPDGFQIVRVPENVDHDEISEAVRDWLATKDRAHHPDSPAGRDISECEDNVLRGKFARVVGG